MSLLALIGTGAAGAALSAWGLGRGGRAARAGAVVGGLCLLVVVVLALTLDATRVGSTQVPPGAGAFDGRLVATDYLRLVVGLWALDAALLVFVGWLLSGLAGLRGLLPATLAAIVGGTVAFAATDLTLGALAAGAVGLASLAVLLVGADAIAAAARELRVSLVVTALLVIVTAVAPVAGAVVLSGQGFDGAPAGVAPGGSAMGGEATAAIGLLAVVVAFAVALRLGVIPVHLRIPRLTDAAPPIALPLLLAWVPVPLAVAALAVSDRLLAPLALPLEGERWLIVAFGIVTLVAGALAAFIQDDLRHTTGYLIVADAGIVLLGFAVLDPAAWGPTRTWLVAMAASKTALAAWAAVTEDRFDTRSIPDLRGWLRHSPILGAGLALAALATYGLPGWVAAVARADIARLAAGSPVDGLLVVAGLATLPTYVRLLALGAGPATSRVRGAAPERFVPRRTERPDILGAPPASSTAQRLRAGAGATLARTRAGAARARAGAVKARSGAILAGTRAGAARVRAGAARVRAGAGRRAGAARAGSGAAALGRQVARALRRDRTELLAAAVLALAILAALTSWGALDIGGAAGEPAPIVAGPAAD